MQDFDHQQYGYPHSTKPPVSELRIYLGLDNRKRVFGVHYTKSYNKDPRSPQKNSIGNYEGPYNSKFRKKGTPRWSTFGTDGLQVWVYGLGFRVSALGLGFRL